MTDCKHNPNIPCLCYRGSSGKYGTSIETRHPLATDTKYGQCLGDAVPRPVGCMGCFSPYNGDGCGLSSQTYRNVHGQTSEIDFNFPFALVTYSPTKMEKFFQTQQRALLEVPNCGDWQIIHLPTGKVWFEGHPR